MLQVSKSDCAYRLLGIEPSHRFLLKACFFLFVCLLFGFFGVYLEVLVMPFKSFLFCSKSSMQLEAWVSVEEVEINGEMSFPNEA